MSIDHFFFFVQFIALKPCEQNYYRHYDKPLLHKDQVKNSEDLICNVTSMFQQSDNTGKPVHKNATGPLWFDGAIAAFNSNGDLFWSTFFGSSEDDKVHSPHIFQSSTKPWLYINGTTSGKSSIKIPLVDEGNNAYFLSALDGAYTEGLIAKFNLGTAYLNTPDQNIENRSYNSIHVTPNPTYDKISVELLELGNFGVLEVYNEMGQIVISNKIMEKRFEVDLSDLPSGIYIVLAKSENNVASEKIIKR